jgi:hypothetical protein
MGKSSEENAEDERSLMEILIKRCNHISDSVRQPHRFPSLELILRSSKQTRQTKFMLIFSDDNRNPSTS